MASAPRSDPWRRGRRSWQGRIEPAADRCSGAPAAPPALAPQACRADRSACHEWRPAAHAARRASPPLRSGAGRSRRCSPAHSHGHAPGAPSGSASRAARRRDRAARGAARTCGHGTIQRDSSRGPRGPGAGAPRARRDPRQRARARALPPRPSPAPTGRAVPPCPAPRNPPCAPLRRAVNRARCGDARDRPRHPEQAARRRAADARRTRARGCRSCSNRRRNCRTSGSVSCRGRRDPDSSSGLPGNRGRPARYTDSAFPARPAHPSAARTSHSCRRSLPSRGCFRASCRCGCARRRCRSAAIRPRRTGRRSRSTPKPAQWHRAWRTRKAPPDRTPARPHRADCDRAVRARGSALRGSHRAGRPPSLRRAARGWKTDRSGEHPTTRPSPWPPRPPATRRSRARGSRDRAARAARCGCSAACRRPAGKARPDRACHHAPARRPG